MKVIAEEEDTEENMETEEIGTEENEENKGQQENEHRENGEEEKRERGTMMKLLITKKYVSAEDEDDQDVIVKTCRCVQAIVEHWTQ